MWLIGRLQVKVVTIAFDSTCDPRSGFSSTTKHTSQESVYRLGRAHYHYPSPSTTPTPPPQPSPILPTLPNLTPENHCSSHADSFNMLFSPKPLLFNNLVKEFRNFSSALRAGSEAADHPTYTQ